jgi:hypothetical protein
MSYVVALRRVSRGFGWSLSARITSGPVTARHHEMSTAAANAAKKQRGRPFKPGRSGNPAGKAKGTRHRVTVLAEQMMEDEASAVVTAVVEAAKAGDMTAARIVLDRVAPARKGRPVKFTLPTFETAVQVVDGLGAIITAVADGTLTPDEAAAVANLIEMKRKAIETVEIERRIAALE